MSVVATPRMEIEESVNLQRELGEKLVRAASTDTSVTLTGQEALVVIEHMKLSLAFCRFTADNADIRSVVDVDAVVTSMMTQRLLAAFPGYPDQIVRQ